MVEASLGEYNIAELTRELLKIRVHSNTVH